MAVFVNVNSSWGHETACSGNDGTEIRPMKYYGLLYSIPTDIWKSSIKEKLKFLVALMKL